MSASMNYFHGSKFKEAQLAVAFLDYLADHPHRKISAVELAKVFQVTDITVRNCFLPYIKDGIVKIEHQVTNVFYQLKNDSEQAHS